MTDKTTDQHSCEAKIAKRPVAGFAISSAGITPSCVQLPKGEATNFSLVHCFHLIQMYLVFPTTLRSSILKLLPHTNKK
jgi:hypothetical protein